MCDRARVACRSRGGAADAGSRPWSRSAGRAPSPARRGPSPLTSANEQLREQYAIDQPAEIRTSSTESRRNSATHDSRISSRSLTIRRRALRCRGTGFAPPRFARKALTANGCVRDVRAISLLDSPRRRLVHGSSSCSNVKPIRTSGHHPNGGWCVDRLRPPRFRGRAVFRAGWERRASRGVGLPDEVSWCGFRGSPLLASC